MGSLYLDEDTMYYKVLKLWHKSKLAESLKKKRFNFIMEVLAKNDLEMLGSRITLLDLGCENGKDFLRFLFDNERFDLYGIDLRDNEIRAKNFKFFLMDAEKTDFPDKFFDITISMGVLEHIQPIEKLCKVISEIERISKSYYISVPSIATIYEPHKGSFLWQLRNRNNKNGDLALNYYSDEAWLQFNGFKNALTTRKNYLFFINNLWIYKPLD